MLKKGDKTNFPKKGDTVHCWYTGKLQDGTVFDTNVQTGEAGCAEPGVLLQTQRGKQLGPSSSRGGPGPAPEARLVLSPHCRAGPAPAALRFSMRGGRVVF